MFNQHGTDRLAHWKQFRETLEHSQTPYQDLVEFWSFAPFVSPYLNPETPAEWPDPWHLVLDSRLDDLAIALGMLYTIKLTHRFTDAKCEIHTSMLSEEKYPRYFLVVNDQYVLNFEYKTVVELSSLTDVQTRLVWSKVDSL